MELIFFYTGGLFWALFGIAFLLSIVYCWLYGYFHFKKWLYRRKYARMLIDINMTRSQAESMNELFRPYNKEQKQLLYAFIDRIHKERILDEPID